MLIVKCADIPSVVIICYCPTPDFRKDFFSDQVCFPGQYSFREFTCIEQMIKYTVSPQCCMLAKYLVVGLEGLMLHIFS